MAYRYSDTLKWQDEWFVDLTASEKLLFMYLCDSCDIAGFFEISYRKMSFDLNIKESELKGAIKGLERGLILSEDEKCLLVKNFIKHQKNLPINPDNKSHQGILKRFLLYSNKFPNLELDHQNGYYEQGASKPLRRGTGNNILLGNVSSKAISTIETRIKNFKESLYPFAKSKSNLDAPYSAQLVKDFFEYWTEKNKSGSKFRQEMEKTWDTKRRLSTWSTNNFGGNKKTNKNQDQGELVYEEATNKIDHSERED